MQQVQSTLTTIIIRAIPIMRASMRLLFQLCTILFLQGFQFYLMAKDSGMPDGVGNKNIDSFAIDLNIDGGQRLEPQVFQGRFGIAEIELSFDLICTDSYSLPNCMSCDPRTSDLCTQRGTGKHPTLSPFSPHACTNTISVMLYNSLIIGPHFSHCSPSHTRHAHTPST